MIDQVTCVLENGEVGSLYVTLAEAEGISQPNHSPADGVPQPGPTVVVQQPSQTAGILQPSQTTGVLQPSQAGELHVRTAIIHKYCLIISLILHHPCALVLLFVSKTPN